jgi:hypothetical protein
MDLIDPLGGNERFRRLTDDFNGAGPVIGGHGYYGIIFVGSRGIKGDNLSPPTREEYTGYGTH